MKFALLACLAGLFATGCTHTLYNHRADFSEPQRSGPWHDAHQDVVDGKDPANPGKRPLWGPRYSEFDKRPLWGPRD